MLALLPNLSFATPLALLALLALPIWWLWRRRHRPPAIVFSRVSVLANGPRAGRLVTFLLFSLRNILLACAILALARPRSTGHSEENTSEGINIVIVVDLSSSMLAQDFQPENRIEVAKDKIKKFVQLRKSDRIGVVSFAAEALTQVRLSRRKMSVWN